MLVVNKGLIKICLTICGVLGLTTALWAFWIEPSRLTLSDHIIELTKWPPACDGLRVAILADLHIGSPHNGLDKLQNVVRTTNSANPDIVLLAGDFVIQGVVGGSFVSPESTARILKGLNSVQGTYAVLGNHDWWLDPSRVETALMSEGVTVLEDKSIQISVDSCRFHLVGVSDYWEGPHDIAQAFRSVPLDSTSLAFTHNPDIFPHMPSNTSLVIAGHTHGGQVFLPGIGRPIVPSDYGSRYAAGHIEESARHLFVSTGIGTSILPVRFLVPPEITVLNLYGKGRSRN